MPIQDSTGSASRAGAGPKSLAAAMILCITGTTSAARAQPATPFPPRLTFVVHAYANWSKDDRVVFQSNATGNYDLYVIDTDGSDLKLLYASAADDITPVWSSDGSRIAFVSEQYGNRDIFLINADGTGLTRLTDHAANDIHPTWSADGSKLIFSSARDGLHEADFDIYTMNADGTDVRRITSGPEVDTYASWSPDGSMIVTRRVIDGENNEVFAMKADGSDPVNLTNSPAYDGWPVWSPDGRRIAFASGPGGRSPTRVFVMNADGSERRVITDYPPNTDFVYDTQPYWSPRGDRLVFTRYRPGPREAADLCFTPVPPA